MIALHTWRELGDPCGGSGAAVNDAVGFTAPQPASPLRCACLGAGPTMEANSSSPPTTPAGRGVRDILRRALQR